ncbi:sugar ABC transporter ATP-binding protein [Sinisalibacter aestuarii]|uniref:Ribose import ATP-binding protein RbsA 1 n=1 Tax=Sinisalibacter aestuarii TaxID=2949426 RepID=A0ABQ5LRX8_9RHOB|nr:sugar ABC transporter ATP-binding protein [Sinisalibacter aestuarii]GKY87378.1 ribose import ATP-binding protein RbsA 1 [Sinisalibacter aestuarii]
MLTLSGVGKSFGGTVALTDIDLTVETGKVHAFVGENGAGKSTLGKLIVGVHSLSEGRMEVDGTEVSFTSPAQALDHGLAGISQELSLMPQRTVLDNIALGREVMRGPFINARATRRGVEAVMERYAMHVDPDARVGDLPIVEQQKVEILRALSRDARLIVFDEPTARLPSDQVAPLLALVRSLADAGKAVIYVSHFLEEILEATDTVTILRNGRHIRTGPTANETHDSLVEGVTGSVLGEQYPEVAAPDRAAPPVISVTGLSRPGVFENVSFDIHPGEIVGLAGLVGSGRSEIARAILGADPSRGKITFNGREISGSIAARLAGGMAMIPENRREQGLMMGRPIVENVTLPHLSRFSGALGLDRRRERAAADAHCAATEMKYASLNDHADALSGGNQQKILFARTTLGDPALLIADEPTRGVDVGAKRSIYDLIAGLAKQGKAILLISSEIEEILGLSHRVLVVSRGRIAGELEGAALTETALMTAAFSGT